MAAPSEAGPGSADFMIASTPVGGLVCNRSITALMHPPELRVTQTELTLRSHSMLGLRAFEQKVPMSRITSVQLMRGVFWGAIHIETQSGTGADIELRGLDNMEAADLVAILQRCVIHRDKSGSQTEGTAASEL